MVQVSNDPFGDEDRPILPKPDGQNVPDDVGQNSLSSITDKAYKTVASSMMEDVLHQNDPIVALRILETALTNRNVPLAKNYITVLYQLIRKDNALQILTSISRWIHMPEADHQLNFEPSAPPLAETDEERNDNWMKEPLKRLREHILLEIDKHGNVCLKQQEIERLHYQDILDIATRDTLQISSEMLVYCAIMRWASMECQRKGLSTDDVNIKAVLKDLIYAPRYGLMSKKEFRTRTIEGHRGPDRIGLPTDINEKILAFIIQREKKKKPNEPLPYKLSRDRTKEGAKNPQSEPMKEKVIINCLTCFSAVFD